MMSPLQIEMLLYYYYTPAPYPSFPRMGNAQEEIIRYFLSDGLIMNVSHAMDVNPEYTTTEKGRAFVKAICATPMPRQVWVDGNDNIINIEA